MLSTMSATDMKMMIKKKKKKEKREMQTSDINTDIGMHYMYGALEDVDRQNRMYIGQ